MRRFVLALIFGALAPSLVAASTTHEIRFRSGGVELEAFLHRNDDEPSRALAIYLHGNPGRPLDQDSRVADALTAVGVDVFRFNYRGLWGNEGAFTLSNAIGDLEAALDFLTQPETVERYGLNTSRIVLLGYSFGTATALVGSRGDERVSAIVSFAPCDHGYFAREWTDPDSEIRDFLDQTIDALFGEQGPIEQDASVFLDDLTGNSDAFALPAHAASLLDKRLLFFAGIDDSVCFVEDHFFPLYRELKTLGHPALDARVLVMDHGFGGVGFETVLGWTAEWLESSFPRAPSASPGEPARIGSSESEEE